MRLNRLLRLQRFTNTSVTRLRRLQQSESTGFILNRYVAKNFCELRTYIPRNIQEMFSMRLVFFRKYIVCLIFLGMKLLSLSTEIWNQINVRRKKIYLDIKSKCYIYQLFPMVIYKFMEWLLLLILTFITLPFD